MNDDSLQARVRAAASSASTSPLLARTRVEVGQAEDALFPEMLTTLYSGSRGLELFCGTADVASVSSVAPEDLRQTLIELLG